MSTLKTRILHNLQKNSFPEKEVSFPFRSLFEASKNEGVKLSAVLKELEEENIFHSLKEEKIIFRSTKPEVKDEGINSTNPYGVPDEIMQRAMEQIEKMSPEQISEIQEQVKKMSPEERENLVKKAQSFMKK
jgi:hypothetical protein